MHCTQLCCPYLLKDINNIERIQPWATKSILHDYVLSGYKSRLIKLKLLSLMYLFELQDILFAIKSIKTPTNQFNIINYISFNSTVTRSGSSNKLTHLHHYMNGQSRHAYFHYLLSRWKTIIIIDLNQSFDVNESKLKKHNFITIFDDNSHCTLNYQYPCFTCRMARPPLLNLNHFKYRKSENFHVKIFHVLNIFISIYFRGSMVPRKIF